MTSQYSSEGLDGLGYFKDLESLKPLTPPPHHTIKSLADRQAQYETARERIFAQTSHKEQKQANEKVKDKVKAKRATFINKDSTPQS